MLYGFKVVDKKIVIDEEHAPFVIQYFNQRAQGRSVKDIVQDLVIAGAPRHHGKILSVKTFYKAEKNRKYIGEFDFHGEIITDMYPAIIDKEIFDKVQKIVAKNKHSNRAKIDYILTGKMFCGECGAPILVLV